MPLLFAALGLLGCRFDGSGIAPPWDGAPPDANVLRDGQVAPDGAADAQPTTDAGPGPDGQVQLDAQVWNDAGPLDSDGDGEPDVTDNCPNTYNPLQLDFDGDGHGDLCDPDADDDGIPGIHDPDDLFPHSLLYYNDFSSQQPDFDTHGGTWAYQSGSLCQTDTSYLWPRNRLLDSLLPANDMVVETVMTVTYADQTNPNWASAGVGVRSSSLAPGNYYSYLCCLDMYNHRLVLLRSSSGGIIAELDSTPIPVVTIPSTYKLRATAQGGNLGCEILPVGSTTPLAATDFTWASGTAGFFTYRATACWDYLLVYAP